MQTQITTKTLSRVNRIRIDLLGEMLKIRKQWRSIELMKRHDLLQQRVEKCNLLLFGSKNANLYKD